MSGKKKKKYTIRCAGLNISFFIFFLLSGNIMVDARNYFDGVIGGVWNDIDGKPIQVHGGQVQKIGDKWWWIGEDKEDGYRTQNGISMYSSDDLYNWKFESYALRAIRNRADMDTDPYFVNLYGHLTDLQKDEVYQAINTTTSVIERPKMIYNKKTGKYIIWFHADGPTEEAPESGYAAAAAGVAISDSPEGPFTFLKRSRLHQLPDEEYGNEWYEQPGNRGFARDMNLFIDEDEVAYIIYSSEENRTMFISRLNEEYTDLDVPQEPVGLAKNGVDFVRLYPGAQREAPALFKYDGRYYMITSGATGWEPNAARYWVAEDIFGEWKDMGDPCIRENGIPYAASLTFGTQSTNVIPYDAAAGKFIYMGDRWNSMDLSDSRYVWLPVYFTPTGEMELRSTEIWDLSFFDEINTIKFNPDQLAGIYFRNEDLPERMKAQVRNKDKWEEKEVPVSWDTDITRLPPASLTTVTGSFIVNGISQSVTVKVANINEDLLYFIDSGAAEGSDLFDSIQVTGLAPNLINRLPDQPFQEESGWGYTGTVGTNEEGADMDYKNPESRDAFTSGWFAWYNKTIDYKLRVKNEMYRLTMGFQEWWNTGRYMRIFFSYKDNTGNEVIKEFPSFYNRTESTQDYRFELADIHPDDSYITICVEKTGSADPIMSWLALSLTDEITSVNNVFSSGRKLHVFPNPVSQNQPFYVKVTGEKDYRNMKVFIYDLSGQLITQNLISDAVTEFRNLLPGGTYIVNLEDMYTKLIVK
ncbi:MAG: family 43 glycosylhydrolase [Candidatus Azobacteroides sp.]|nr:family 43 glycosylhydrolase [Candidatus Azobacteroides sp.]